MKKTVFLFSMLAITAFPTVANAVVATPATGATSNLSHKVAITAITVGGGVATAGIVNKSWLGTVGGVLLGGGGVALSIVDPPAGTFYSGSFTFYYDTDLMKPTYSGWLGDWGADPSLLAPPVDPNQWDGTNGNGTTVTLQQPNPNLSAAIMDDSINGLQTISFDWGTNGYSTNSTEPFNFFATAFEFTSDVELKYLGDFAQPPSEANFYISTPGFQCTLAPDEITIRTCGEPSTSYYSVRSVPEPSSILGASVALGLGFGGLLKRKLAKNQKDKKS